MGGDDHAAPTDPTQDDGPTESLPRSWAKALFRLSPWGLKQQVEDNAARLEGRLDALESAVRTIQDELAAVRDDRLTPLERRADAVELGAHEVSEEMNRLRDRVVPAAVARSDALLDRIAEELEETSSLVERSLRNEPLPVATGNAVVESGLAEALDTVQPLLLESFRGSDEEIRHRLDRYLPDLVPSSPVLDLGCGRGELLLLLREAGVDATGVEGDTALYSAAIRRGLKAVEGDVLEVLRGQGDGVWGAVTAIHFFEHLQPQTLAAVLVQVRRVLRPGGLLIAECPNPHSLRVGGALFWQDPTHSRPLLPETLELFVQASGFVLERRETMHPFPSDQLLVDDEGGTRAVVDEDLTELAERVDRLRSRLDEILNGPRDFAVWARKPTKNT
jgi:O-antigen chain-terminating methyltransferase